MQPSDLVASAYQHLQAPKAEQARSQRLGDRPASSSAPASQFDTTSVSASARALTVQNQVAEAANPLSAARVAHLRDRPVDHARVALAILQSDDIL